MPACTKGGIARSPKRDVVNPFPVVEHIPDFPQETLPEVSPGLHRTVADSQVKGMSEDTRYIFTHCTGYPRVLNDPRSDDGVELMAVSAALKGSTYLAPKRPDRQKMISKLTSSRVTYSSMLGVMKNPTIAKAMRGVSMAPERLHDLPYGSECPELIGPKLSTYRHDYRSTTPREPPPAIITLPRPQCSDVPASSKQGSSPDLAAGLRPTLYTTVREDDTPSGRAEQYVDTQARRELSWLKQTTAGAAGAAGTMRTINDLLLTPRRRIPNDAESEEGAMAGGRPSGFKGHSTESDDLAASGTYYEALHSLHSPRVINPLSGTSGTFIGSQSSRRPRVPVPMPPKVSLTGRLSPDIKVSTHETATGNVTIPFGYLSRAHDPLLEQRGRRLSHH